MKIVIITGTSGGLGQAFFDYFCKEDVYLFCISRRFLTYQLDASQTNSKMNLIYADLKDTQCVKTALESFEQLFVSIPVDQILFINNAGIIDPITRVGNLDAQEVLDAIHVNVTAPILLTNEIIRIVEHSDVSLVLLNISTGAANTAIDSWSIYCSTKAGSQMFFNAVSKQFVNNPKITIHQIDPGVMDTAMQERIRTVEGDNTEHKAYFISLKSDNKLLNPHEVAYKIVKEYCEV